MEPLLNPLVGPLRAVNWRWQVGLDLAENRDGSFRWYDDAAIQLAKRFRYQWMACRNEAAHRRLAARMPVLYQAFSLNRDPLGVSRSALEARLLADESHASIASKSATPVAVIQAYASLFFDVGDRLGNPDYIFNQVIGPRLRDSAADWSYDLVWKFFGYVGGVLVLDELMDSVQVVTRPKSLKEVVTFLSEDAKTTVRRRLTITARALMPGDRHLASALVQLVSDRVQEEALPFPLQHIQAMLEEIPWVSGMDAHKHLPPKVAEYDQSAVELRDNDQMLLATGQETPEIAAMKDMKLPPPRDRKKETSHQSRLLDL